MSEINFPNFNTLLTSRELQAKTIYDLFRHLKDVEKDSEAYNALRQEVQELCDEIRSLDPSMSEEEAIQALAAKQAIVEADLVRFGQELGEIVLSIDGEMVVNEDNTALSDGYATANGIASSTTHKYAVIDVPQGAEKITYTVTTQPASSLIYDESFNAISLNTVGTHEIDISSISKLYLNFFSGGTYCDEYVITKEGMAQKVSQNASNISINTAKINNVDKKIDDVNIQIGGSLNVYKGVYGYSFGSTTLSKSTSATISIIEVSANDVLKFTPNTDTWLVYAILKEIPVISGDSFDLSQYLVSGGSRVAMSSGYQVTIPSDGVAMVLQGKTSATNDRTPKEIYINGVLKSKTLVSIGDKADEIDEIKVQLFGSLDFSNNGYINNTTGAFASTNAWRSTDYIPICEGDVLSIYSHCTGSVAAAFYDINKTFISATAGGSVGSRTITAPTNAAFFRASNEPANCMEPSIKLSVNIYDKIVKALNIEIPSPTNPILLFDSIQKPISFSGKTMNVFGDSITYGIASPNLQNAGENGYIALFASHVGVNIAYRNWAVSGSTLTTGNVGYGSICDKIQTISNAADIIWVAGGVNDWQLETTIGVYGDTDTTTVYGAMSAICSYIKTTWPGAVVIFVTPIPTTSLTAFGSTHPDNLNEYRKAIQEVAMANGFNVINGADLGMPNFKGGFGNAMVDDTDCIHPTLAGHSLYARSLAGKLL